MSVGLKIRELIDYYYSKKNEKILFQLIFLKIKAIYWKIKLH